MRFITFATHEERMLPLLIESAKRNNINLEIFGKNKTWKNYGNKMYEINNYIKNIPDEEIIVFFDAFDTVILTDEKEFLKKFNIINNKIKDVNKKDLIFANGRNCIKYLKYLFLETNGGLFIGKARKMKFLFNKIHKKYNWNKQGSGDVLLERYKKYFFIDNSYELFYNLYFDGTIQKMFTKKKCKTDVKIINKRIKINNNYPIAIHFPKNSIDRNMLKQLGYKYKNEIDNTLGYLVKDHIKYYSKYTIKYFILFLFIIFIYIMKK